jgi:hypothetical protein
MDDIKQRYVYPLLMAGVCLIMCGYIYDVLSIYFGWSEKMFFIAILTKPNPHGDDL